MKTKKTSPLDRLKHHVTGAIERGEKQAIKEINYAELDWFVKNNVNCCLSTLIHELAKDPTYTDELVDSGLLGGYVPCDRCHSMVGCNECDAGERLEEVFEHWAISPWLAERLMERGERVAEFMGLTVWGRQTTGQSISMDRVIQDIFKGVMK